MRTLENNKYKVIFSNENEFKVIHKSSYSNVNVQTFLSIHSSEMIGLL